MLTAHMSMQMGYAAVCCRASPCLPVPLQTRRYERGTDDQQKFVQNLALFFTGFFKVGSQCCGHGSCFFVSLACDGHGLGVAVSRLQR